MDVLKVGFEAPPSSGESVQGGASYVGPLSNPVEKVGTSGSSGSCGGVLIGLSVGLFEAAGGAGKDAGGAVERRWSRRQYEKTVEGAMSAAQPKRAAPI